MSRRVLGPDAREFFEAAGYTIHEPTNPSTRDRGFFAVEPLEVGRLYERIRGLWFGNQAKPTVVELLRAVRLDPSLIAALESAWLLGGSIALHDAACVAIGIEPDSDARDEQDFWRRALAKRPSHTDGG